MIKEIDKVVNILGSQAALATALGLSNNAISKWMRRGHVPPGRAIEVAHLVKGKLTSFGEEVTLESLLLEAQSSSQRLLCSAPRTTSDTKSEPKPEKNITTESVYAPSPHSASQHTSTQQHHPQDQLHDHIRHRRQEPQTEPRKEPSYRADSAMGRGPNDNLKITPSSNKQNNKSGDPL